VPGRNELHVIINMRVKTDCLNLSILHNLEYTRLYAKEMYETISFQILRISGISQNQTRDIHVVCLDMLTFFSNGAV